MTDGCSGQVRPAFVDLHSLLASVPDHVVLAKPALASLMVEYACWDRQTAEWYERRMPKRNNQFSLWIVEGRALFSRRDELAQVACALLRSGSVADAVG
jgi:hypothetical protein